MPLYRQKLKAQSCKTIEIKQWSDENVDKLRGCLECTEWDTLLHDMSDLDHSVDVCTDYISFCINMIIPSKMVTVFPNNKPWVTKDVKEIINRKMLYA